MLGRGMFLMVEGFWIFHQVFDGVFGSGSGVIWVSYVMVSCVSNLENFR